MFRAENTVDYYDREQTSVGGVGCSANITADLVPRAGQIKLSVEVPPMQYHLASALLMVAAVVLQIAGFSGVGTAVGVTLLGAGVGLELCFWVRLSRTRGLRADP